MSGSRQGPLARLLYRAPIALYRAGLGFLLGSRFMMLVHRGRRSGRRRETVLEVIRHEDEPRRYLVASGFGRGSDWYRNVLASPEVEVCVGRRRSPARARELPLDEAAEELRRYAVDHPLAARAIARILGVPFDGSPEQIRALAERVPIVELRTVSG